MYIKFTNFRCYKDETFNFEDNGFFLISAPSGYGKSTILTGINFALYGLGTKHVRRNETSAKVEFQFKDLKIVRSIRPNRLLVNDVYEDEAGQAIINESFGYAFNKTGYIAQNQKDTFLLMNPADKLSFLEQFAYKDINIPEIKARCKAYIKNCHDEHLKCHSQLQVASKLIDEIDEPELIPFPIKTKNIDITTKNETIRLKNSSITLKKLQNELKILTTSSQDTNILSLHIDNKNKSISSIENKICKLQRKIDETSFIGDNDLNTLKNTLQMIQLEKEFQQLNIQFENDKNSLEKMKLEETSEINSQIQTIKNSLWNVDEYTKDEAISLISNLKSSLEDTKQLLFLESQLQKQNTLPDIEIIQLENDISNLNEELIDLRKHYNNLKQINKKYNCPSCKTPVFIKNEELEILQNIHEFDSYNLNELHKQIQKTSKNIDQKNNIIIQNQVHLKKSKELLEEINTIKSQYEDYDNDNDIIHNSTHNINSIKNDLEDIQTYYQAQLKLEKKLHDLETKLQNNEFSKT